MKVLYVKIFFLLILSFTDLKIASASAGSCSDLFQIRKVDDNGVRVVDRPYIDETSGNYYIFPHLGAHLRLAMQYRIVRIGRVAPQKEPSFSFINGRIFNSSRNLFQKILDAPPRLVAVGSEITVPGILTFDGTLKIATDYNLLKKDPRLSGHYLEGNNPVSGAFELTINNGTILSIRNRSFLYRPPIQFLENVIVALEKAGADLSIAQYFHGNEITPIPRELIPKAGQFFEKALIIRNEVLNTLAS